MALNTWACVSDKDSTLHELAFKPFSDIGGTPEYEYRQSLPGEYYYMSPFVANIVLYTYSTLANYSLEIEAKMTLKPTPTVTFIMQLVRGASILSYDGANTFTIALAMSHAYHELANTNMGLISMEQIEMYKKIMNRIRPIYKSGLFVLNMIDSSILNLEHNIDEYNSKLAQKTRVGVGTNSSKIYQV